MNKVLQEKTPFQQAVLNHLSGKLQIPKVSTESGDINYFGYQLAVHKFNLSLMTKGLKSRGVKLSDLKRYYGLKGRTAKDCLPRFLEIMEDYKKTLKT